MPRELNFEEWPDTPQFDYNHCRTGTVYYLVDPRETSLDKRIRYVGLTVAPPARRLEWHIQEAINKTSSQVRRSHRLRWIRKLLSEGVRPALEVVEQFPIHSHLCLRLLALRERCEIAWCKAQGCMLTNYSAGGEVHKLMIIEE